MNYSERKKAERTLETYVLVNNNLCRILFSSLESPAAVDESLKVTSVPFFIPDFNLLSCELDNTDIILNKNKFWNTQ